MSAKMPDFYLSEQQAFDIFVKHFGRYPKDQAELREVAGYCAPLIGWDEPIEKPAKAARKSWIERIAEYFA